MKNTKNYLLKIFNLKNTLTNLYEVSYYRFNFKFLGFTQQLYLIKIVLLHNILVFWLTYFLILKIKTLNI